MLYNSKMSLKVGIMLKNLKLKSLAFYGCSIGAVLILFKVVTNYGENNLKAPPSIQGNYLITNLPGCAKKQDFILDINQSGIYLSGSLLPENSNKLLERSAEKKPSLDGRWQDETINLSGLFNTSKLCPGQQTASTTASKLINIQATVQGETLTGKITFDSMPKAVIFTAKREKTLEKTKDKH